VYYGLGSVSDNTALHVKRSVKQSPADYSTFPMHFVPPDLSNSICFVMPFDLLFHAGSDLSNEMPSVPNSCSSPKRSGYWGYGEQSETEAIPVRNFHYFPLVVRESDLAILPDLAKYFTYSRSDPNTSKNIGYTENWSQE
jgi:hypothetical protein